VYLCIHMQTHPARIFRFNDLQFSQGPVIYWMQRDQRLTDNWALIYAQEKAQELKQPLMVIFCLVTEFLGASAPHYQFMMKGLEGVDQSLKRLEIPFQILMGNPVEMIPRFIDDHQAGFLVTDFNPLRIAMGWRRNVTEKIRIPFVEVDAHNILPCREMSDKQEYSAFTLRKKITCRLNEFLEEYPESMNPGSGIRHPVATHKVISDFIQNRLDRYATDRNDPNLGGQSGLSPYLHFGQISAQRVALEVQKADADPVSKQAFLEELIVRKELSDNFCLHHPNYDSYGGLPDWGKRTLEKHRDDARPFLYSLEEFEQATTHDRLWNAAQKEMVDTGKMHGYLRMYWAKKILEWSHSPEEAMEIAVYLNDRYSLDGRDPNGYSGIAWSIGGLHDRPWTERPVFGMIRYMNEAGCRRKFDVEQYIRKFG